MANLKNLQHAASEAAGKSASSNRRGPEPTPAGVADAAPPTRSNARAGKIAMTFHLSEDFKRGLRLVQARRGHGCTLEQLAAEALNDLFGKYNVPTVSTDS